MLPGNCTATQLGVRIKNLIFPSLKTAHYTEVHPHFLLIMLYIIQKANVKTKTNARYISTPPNLMIQSKEFYTNSVVWEICISYCGVFNPIYSAAKLQLTLRSKNYRELEFENSFYYYFKIPIIMEKNVRRGRDRKIHDLHFREK